MLCPLPCILLCHCLSPHSYVRCSPPCRPNFPPRSALTHERTAHAAQAAVSTANATSFAPRKGSSSIPPSLPPRQKRTPSQEKCRIFSGTERKASSPSSPSLPLTPSRPPQHTNPATAAMLNLLCKSEPQRGILGRLARSAADDATASDSESTRDITNRSHNSPST